MKKAIVLVCFSLLLATTVMATSRSQAIGTIGLAQKNSNDWSIVEGGASGYITLSTVTAGATVMQERLNLQVYDLEPLSVYQTIYYGYEDINDVWPYATCIGPDFRAGMLGQRKISLGSFDYLNMLDDGISQKFWVVKASDVDCNNHRMIAWNPSEYLFEKNTI